MRQRASTYAMSFLCMQRWFLTLQSLYSSRKRSTLTNSSNNLQLNLLLCITSKGVISVRHGIGMMVALVEGQRNSVGVNQDSNLPFLKADI